MKNIINLITTLRIAGIIAVAAAIGFTMTACDPMEDTELSGTITISPIDDVDIGTELTATYSGSETVSYHWKNGPNDVGANSNKFTPDSAGTYTVTVGASGYKAKTSSPVTVSNEAVNVFNSVAALKEWLIDQEENDSDSFYKVKLNISTLGDPLSATGSVGSTLNSEVNKFVHLNLSGSTFTVVDDWAFFMCDTLVGITLPNTVTGIGLNAFKDCTSLTDITIPDNVTSIGKEVFSGCKKLTSVTIGDKVSIIEVQAFESCISLKNVTISNSVTSIEDNAFLGCKNLESVTIPNGVISIWDNAFRDCEGLKNVTIGEKVTNIGDNAFRGCTSLTDITIPDRVISIGESAFRDCSGLKNVTIGNKVTSIGADIFEGCSNSEFKIIITSAVVLRKWLSSEPANTSDTPCTVKLKVRELGGSSSSKGSVGYAVSNSGKFVNLDISGSILTDIEAMAFYGCTKLTGITLPNSINGIRGNAFNGCANLSSITIPVGVKFIENKAFFSCAELESVTFEGKINKDSFDAEAFSGNLYEVFYEDDPAKGTPGTYTLDDDGLTWGSN